MRTLETGVAVEGDEDATNAVAELTNGAGQVALVQRRTCVPVVERRTS